MARPKCTVIFLRCITNGRRLPLGYGGEQRRDCIRFFAHGRILPFSGGGYADKGARLLFLNTSELIKPNLTSLTKSYVSGYYEITFQQNPMQQQGEPKRVGLHDRLFQENGIDPE